MENTEVHLTLPAHTVGAAQQEAHRAGTDLDHYAARAIRNQTLRDQLAHVTLPEVPGWLDDAEADEPLV